MKRAPPHFTVKDLRRRGIITRKGRPSVELCPNAEGDPWAGCIPWQAIVPELIEGPSRVPTVEELNLIGAAMLEVQAYAQWKWLDENPGDQGRERVGTLLNASRDARLVAEKKARDELNLTGRQKRLQAATLAEWFDRHPRKVGQSVANWLDDAAEELGESSADREELRLQRTLWRRWSELKD